MRRTTVGDVMSDVVLSVGPAAPIAEVAAVLMSGGVRAVPVIDDGELTGVVSEADLLAAVQPPETDGQLWWHRPRHIHRTGANSKAGAATARELMTTTAVAVQQDMPVAGAARIMREHGLSWLPVLDGDGSVVGVLGRSDLLAVFHRPDAAIRAEVVSDVLERILMVGPSRVSVRVAEGVVTLSGQMGTWADKELAVRFTERLEGVVDVVDRLSYRVDERIS